MSSYTYRTFPPRSSSRPTVAGRILSLNAPEMSCSALSLISGSAASGAWISANKAVAMPFRLSYNSTVFQLGWRNGSGTMTDSVDVGIYTSTFVRLVSGGGTARSGASLAQWVDVTDTVLSRGVLYYLVTANNGTTASNVTFSTAAQTAVMMSLFGTMDSGDSLYPLPDPLTNMVASATFTRLPVTMMAMRVPF